MSNFISRYYPLTKEQIKSTLHLDYRNNKKVLDDYTSSLIYFVSDEGPNKSIILEYNIYTYVNKRLHSQNNKIVILDSIGNVLHKLENIKFATQHEVITDDLRYICFGVVDIVNTIDPETGGGPTGLMLYDFLENKYLIHKMFPSVEDNDRFPNSPTTQWTKYIKVYYNYPNVPCEYVKIYEIDIKNEVIYTYKQDDCESISNANLDWFFESVKKGELNKIVHPDLLKYTYSQFNSLIFK